MKFTEAKLEQAFIELLANEGYPHTVGSSIVRSGESEVLIEEDLQAFLLNRYQNTNLTETEAASVILQWLSHERDTCFFRHQGAGSFIIRLVGNRNS